MHRRGEKRGLHRRVVRLGDVVQPVPHRVRGKLGERAGIVHRGEFIVKEQARRLCAHVRDRVAQVRGVGTRLILHALRKRIEHLHRARHLRLGRRERADFLQQNFPHTARQRPAGKRVVAHIRDAIWRERPGAEREKPVAHLRRHPRIDAVRDDVIERALRLPRAQVGTDEARVPNPARRARSLCGCDLLRGKIHADEFRFRKPLGERQQIHPFAATEFEHAAVIRRRGVDAEQPRDRSYARRM